MTKYIIIILCHICILSTFAQNFDKEYTKLISKLDIADTTRSLVSKDPSDFWKSAINNNESLLKFLIDIHKNKGAEQEALKKTATLPHFYPKYDSWIIDSLQGLCDTLLIDMGIADLNLKCSLHIVEAPEANGFTALTEDGFAMCLTSGLLAKKGINRNIIMGYIAYEFAHGALFHHIRTEYTKAKQKRKENIEKGIATGITAVAAATESINAIAFGTPTSNTDYYSIIKDINNNTNYSTLSYLFNYSREQVHEADLLAFRFLENLGYEDEYLDCLRILGSEYDHLHDNYNPDNEFHTYPSISTRINFLKFVKENPRLGNQVNKGDITEIKESQLKDIQVNSICSIPFGASQTEAYDILNKNFGEPNSLPIWNEIIYKNIKYARMNFDSVQFLFHSNGIENHLNSCIFTTEVSDKDQAIETLKNYKTIIGRKYNLTEYIDENGFRMYQGGISPFWDGQWYDIMSNLSTKQYMPAITTNIIEYDDEITQKTGNKYAVQIIYGPYEYSAGCQ